MSFKNYFFRTFEDVFYCSVIKVPVVLTALIFYHIVLSLSRTFLSFFNFFVFRVYRSFATTPISYHVLFILSSTFFIFFLLISGSVPRSVTASI